MGKSGSVHWGVVLSTLVCAVICSPGQAAHPTWSGTWPGAWSAATASEIDAEVEALSNSLPPADQQKLRWIERAARALRAGHGITLGENPRALLNLSHQQIIDRFMHDPRFGDTVLDFNLFYLGLKPDQIKNRAGIYNREAFSAPNAITSAQALLRGEDYFKLLTLDQPLFLGALNRPTPRMPGDDKLQPEDLRQLMYKRLNGDLDQMSREIKENPKLKRSEFRKKADIIFNGDWFFLGLQQGITSWLLFAKGWYGDLLMAAFDDKIFAKTNLLETIEKVKEVNRKFFVLLNGYLPGTLKTKTILDIKPIDLTSLGVSGSWNLFTGNSIRLPNSSTNYNRRRSAYVLSRFFCDDLTPINVISPGNHSQGKHATDPSCRACHYKLDPMAGFFRDHGLFFRSYNELPFIVFDDGASMGRQTYTDFWKAASDAGREWDVGYIRSTEDPLLNRYGSSLENLMTIVREEPEVRSCFVRRMFEYLVAEKQAVDGGYLELLTKRFNETTKTNSSLAVKNLMSQILLSQSFVEPDPVPQKCYDFPPGHNPANSPPCQVAYVLRNNCTECHHSLKNRIDLSKWVQLADGSYNFPHLSAQGLPHSKSETYQILLERITSPDEEKRMPKKQYISNADREQLFLWLKQTLNKNLRSEP